MENYLLGGKRAIYPHVTRIAHMLQLEKTLAECWNKVKADRRRRNNNSMLDVTSVASSQNLREDATDIGLSDPDDDDDNASAVQTPTLARRRLRVPSLTRVHSLDDAHDKGKRHLPSKKSFSRSHSNNELDTHYHQLEWEYKRLQTRYERLRSENVDLRRRLEDIRNMCAPTIDTT